LPVGPRGDLGLVFTRRITHEKIILNIELAIIEPEFPGFGGVASIRVGRIGVRAVWAQLPRISANKTLTY
jgi:hypothetical protein